jgi:hypothetical protein
MIVVENYSHYALAKQSLDSGEKTFLKAHCLFPKNTTTSVHEHHLDLSALQSVTVKISMSFLETR